jgi:thymidylate synthase
MNTLDSKYQDLLQDILDNGVVKSDRTGTGTISVFGRQIKHKMSQGFPLLTTKKMAWKTMVTELLWFLKGDTNIKYLVDNGCNIWNGDAFKNYTKEVTELIDGYMCGDIMGMQQHIEDMFSNPDHLTPLTQEEFIDKIKTNDQFAKKWGDLGPIYGKQWRSWGGRNILNYDLQNVKWSDKDKVMELIRDGGDYSKYDVKVTYRNNSIDQIQNLINDLKTNPDSRRLIVNAWNVGELDQMVLPPCHYGFQVYTRKLSGEEMWDLLKKKVGEERFKLMVEDIAPFGGGLSEELQAYNIPKRAISLMWNQRSVDTFLGLPFNIASYGLLLEILAREVNMVTEDLIGNLGDVHLYSNHIEQAKEQIGREPYKNLPILNFSPIPSAHFEHHLDSFNDFVKGLQPYQFIIDEYESHPTIKAPLSN